MLKKLCAVIFLFAVIHCSAQNIGSIKSFQFHSINNIGLLEGQAGSAFQLQTINGVQHKLWFAGVGVGIDYDRYRTIPLFVDVRKEFGKNSNKFFLYADAGINFSWVTDKEKIPYIINDKFSSGFYSDAGAGYKISLHRNNSLLLSIGYSFKRIEQKIDNEYANNPGGVVGGIFNPLPFVNEYRLNRLSVKIGWEF